MNKKSYFLNLDRLVKTAVDFIQFILHVIVMIFIHPPRFGIVRDQLFEVGVMSLSLLAISGFTTGSALAAQTFFNLEDKGLTSATGLVVTKAMMVEVGPVLTAFMLIGRVGSAMCAELGTMRVSEQIDALESMSIDPLRFLVAPRIIAGVVMLPVLTVFTTVTGIIGAYTVAVYYYDMSPATFLDPLPMHIHIFDFVNSLFKAMIFGIFIVSISCYRGMSVSGGAAGVGQATTQCVVYCYCFVLVGNTLLTLVLNNSYDFIEQLFGGGS